MFFNYLEEEFVFLQLFIIFSRHKVVKIANYCKLHTVPRFWFQWLLEPFQNGTHNI